MNRDDPPDEPDPPEWYANLEDAIEDEDMPEAIAKIIRKAIDDWADEYNAAHEPEPPDEPLPDHTGCRQCGNPSAGCIYCSTDCAAMNPCPHGNTPGDCDACDHLADLAYDASR
jgi:hypothetical protein